jgi:hypothetical protein
MQFVVPQFIDVEDKIIGPVTTRQFIITIVGGIIIFLEYKLSDFGLFVLLAFPTAVVFGALAFLKINGMPFHFFLINFLETLKLPGLRLWKKNQFTKTVAIEKKVEAPSVAIKQPLSVSHLADLSLIVDTGGAYHGQDAEKEDSGFKNV